MMKIMIDVMVAASVNVMMNVMNQAPYTNKKLARTTCDSNNVKNSLNESVYNVARNISN